MSRYITYKEFDPTKLSGADPQTKSFNNGAISYKEIPLFYNYGTVEQVISEPFYMELPEIESTGIIVKEEQKQGKDGAYTKTSYSMMFKFDLSNPEHVEALAQLDRVHAAASFIIGQNKGKLKWFDYDWERPGNLFKNPVYYHKDELTGEKIAGRNPTLWAKLNHWENNKTLFTPPLSPGQKEPNSIDWPLLRGVDLKSFPLIHFEKNYIGSKASLQIKLPSSIVTEIHKTGTVSRQTSTFERLQQKRPGLADSVAAQLAQLQMDRQDQLEVERSNPGSFHSVPDNNSNSNHDTTSDINDFLGAAPTMQPISNPVTQLEPPPLNLNQPVQYNPNLNIQQPVQATSQPTVLRIN